MCYSHSLCTDKFWCGASYVQQGAVMHTEHVAGGGAAVMHTEHVARGGQTVSSQIVRGANCIKCINFSKI